METTTLTRGTVYSSRERVNVIIPGTAFWGEGNHFFTPVRGNAIAYIRECITEVIRAEAEIGKEYARKIAAAYSTPRNEIPAGEKGYGLPSWAFGEFEIAISPKFNRGEYAFHVYRNVTDQDS